MRRGVFKVTHPSVLACSVPPKNSRKFTDTTVSFLPLLVGTDFVFAAVPTPRQTAGAKPSEIRP
jgi:hypothetical protein